MSHVPAVAQESLEATIEAFLADGTYTFLFKLECAEQDKNCLPVPAGAFDIAGRFYGPRAPLLRKEWQLKQPVLEGQTARFHPNPSLRRNPSGSQT